MVASSPTKSNTAVAPRPPVSSRTRVGVLVVGEQRVVRAELPCEVEALLDEVDRDHLGAGEAPEVLHRVRAEATGADHDRGRNRG